MFYKMRKRTCKERNNSRHFSIRGKLRIMQVIQTGKYKDQTYEDQVQLQQGLQRIRRGETRTIMRGKSDVQSSKK